MKLLIYGSGGNGCEIADIAHEVNAKEERWESIEFIDDIRKDSSFYGLRVNKFENIIHNRLEIEVVISLGEPFHRKKLLEKLRQHDIPLAKLVHPKAQISKQATIEPGVIVGFNSFISSNTRVAANTMIEVNTIIGHDITIEESAVISSCSVIGGNAYIGECAFVGLNCSVKEKISIGSWSIIGMGASVFSDIPSEKIAIGNPARPVKENEKKRVFE